MRPADSDQALRNILDNLDAVVYVADMHSHELLFINAYARERLLDGAAGEAVLGRRPGSRSGRSRRGRQRGLSAAMRYLIGSRTTTGMRRSVAAWYLA